MLSCPSCHALVHSTKLKALAAAAERRAQAKDLVGERDAWNRALELLPSDSQQHGAITARVAALNSSISNQPVVPRTAATTTGPWWKRWLAGGGALFLFALGKLKFLLLGLTKISTLLSMFAFVGVYWQLYGWPLALGFVASIYIHEMGHVTELKRLGIEAGAPVFIPGVGALVLLKKHVSDPVVDARIGLAGPIYGLAAGLAALIVGVLTRAPIWFAIAHITGYINLFNLIPIWQLDGSRGFHALGRGARWVVAASATAMFVLAAEPMAMLVAIVAGFRAFEKTAVRTDRRTLVTFIGLVVLLSVLSARVAAVRR
jgi:Zn-dependent protease